MSEKDFELLNPIFLNEIKKENMPGEIYARWFDRILYVKGERQLYGEYLSNRPCVENLKKTNIARKKIGLKRLRKKTAVLTRYIANRAFGGLRKFSAIYKHRQIVDLAFKNE